jgi:hypothetical protein
LGIVIHMLVIMKLVCMNFDGAGWQASTFHPRINVKSMASTLHFITGNECSLADQPYCLCLAEISQIYRYPADRTGAERCFSVSKLIGYQCVFKQAHQPLRATVPIDSSGKYSAKTKSSYLQINLA